MALAASRTLAHSLRQPERVPLGEQRVSELNVIMSLKSFPSAPSRGVLAAGACVLAGAVIHPGLSQTANAQPRTTNAPLEVALRYSAPPGCPEREIFLDLVQPRAPHVRLVPADASVSEPLEVEVVLGEVPEGSSAVARISRDGTVRDERTFRGSDCLEVARAAALSVAFALETQSAEAAGPAPSEAEPREAEPAEAAAQSTSEPTPSTQAVPGPVSTTPQSVVFGVGIAPLAASLLNEPWLVGGDLWLGARQAHGLGASARLGVLVADSGKFDSTARYRWIAAEARLCPFRLGETWTLSACAQATAGALGAEGVEVEFPRDVSVSWVALGPSLETSISVATSTRLVASVSATAPLSERTFVFERPRRVVTRSESVGWLVSVGVEHDIGGG